MTLPIFLYGSEVLREVAVDVDIEKREEIELLISQMRDTMKNADGVGIAAPQVGRSIRLLIVDGSDLSDDYPELKDFVRVMINPVVEWESEVSKEYSEGCLSVPTVNADIQRPEEMRVSYLNDKFVKQTETFTGFGCRMVQHELDHLDGILFVDRATPIRKKMIQAKLQNITKGKVRTSYKNKIK